jgi:hypothetical protein
VDVGAIRHGNLLALLKALPATRVEFAREMQITPAYISQIIHRHRGRKMGHAFARRIEQHFNLPRGWMDQPRSFGQLSMEAMQLGEQWDALPEPSKSHIRALIEHFVVLELKAKTTA